MHPLPCNSRYLVKRSQGRRKGPKNFRRRYFTLTAKSLTYCKSQSEPLALCEIPANEMLAVERVDDQAFNMKFVSLPHHTHTGHSQVPSLSQMFQVIQPSRILYMQAKNSLELKEWYLDYKVLCNNHCSWPTTGCQCWPECVDVGRGGKMSTTVEPLSATSGHGMM